MRELRDVVAPIAQGGHLHGKDRQAEVEVLAELPGRHGLAQAAVGGRDDADIKLDGRAATQPFDLARLDGAQHLGLHGHRHLADLIQEQRAALGQFESTQLALVGAGKCPALVTKQLRLEQRIRNGRAVDGDERTVGARAAIVEGAGAQLLAGAAFTFEQHGGVGGGGTINGGHDLAQRRRVANDVGPTAACGSFLFQQAVVVQQASLRERALDEQQEMIRVDGLGQEVQRALLHGRHGILDAAVRGHHNHRQFGVGLLGRAQHAKAIAHGKT